jgi:hypothetical protein
MPLTQLSDEIASAGFVIERLVEPTPEREMATTHPETYTRLMTEPGFVLLKLRPSPRDAHARPA